MNPLPSRLLLNVDTGERGADHAVDHELVKHADVVNLACGGHAGDDESIRVFSGLAKRLGKTVAAHLSYPDREHFGRRRLDISEAELQRALDAQRARLPEPECVKFHGALYHEADRDPALARTLAAWLTQAGFTIAIAPVPGALARESRERGMRVLAEGFVERRYHRPPENPPDIDVTQAVLMPRSHPDACLETLPEALAQAEDLITQGEVRLYPDGAACRVEAETLCIHSDSPIALELAAALAERLRCGSGVGEGRP
ncbi:MAG: LamB/YcsF family protein [Planctomycetota bacterium]